MLWRWKSTTAHVQCDPRCTCAIHDENLVDDSPTVLIATPGAPAPFRQLIDPQIFICNISTSMHSEISAQPSLITAGSAARLSFQVTTCTVAAHKSA